MVAVALGLGACAVDAGEEEVSTDPYTLSVSPDGGPNRLITSIDGIAVQTPLYFEIRPPNGIHAAPVTDQATLDLLNDLHQQGLIGDNHENDR